MSIVTSEEIEQGEEIQVSYNYDIQKSPEWYQVRISRKYQEIYITSNGILCVMCIVST